MDDISVDMFLFRSVFTTCSNSRICVVFRRLWLVLCMASDFLIMLKRYISLNRRKYKF